MNCFYEEMIVIQNLTTTLATCYLMQLQCFEYKSGLVEKQGWPFGFYPLSQDKQSFIHLR